MWVLPVLTFINYDCRYTPEKVVPWDYWRSTALYGGAQASLNYAHKAAVEHREDAIEECPLGLLFSDVIYATMCFRQNDSDCYQRADEHVRFAHKSRMRGGHGDIISWDRQSSRDLTPERDAAASLRRLNDDGRMVIEKMTKKTQLW
eukprot:GEMP01046743.1.p1 GENE.GEMP01046743.1~~GEMP01046743.1.p1  ORF type:complete len:162 (+),score=19.19 GEMP01046743.1:48-488(+)